MTAARVRILLVCAAAIAAVGVLPATAAAQVDRLVVVKMDGLPYWAVDRAVHEVNPRTGKSVLPWIDHVFYRNGTRLSNFYVRGMSLSGPSWSLLDTGQHLQIRGNVEFDRFTLHSYDYLNFIPFWLSNALRKRGDMWGTSVLDDLGVRLLLDAYPHAARYQSFELYQRGSRWVTLSEALQKRVTTRGPKELFDEWRIGIDGRAILTEQLERELVAALENPGVRYLDYYTTEFDHDAHLNHDWATHRATLQGIDALVGRIWTAIQRSPLASRTALVLLSDHGVNTDERVYSQGYSMVDLLRSASGGGHHVITKRRPLMDYSIKGINPLVPLITTSSNESRYLKGQENTYPTALVDFDGNERVSIHLRHSVLNMVHILLQQLRRDDLSPELRQAAEDALRSIRDTHRARWQQTIDDIREELVVLERSVESLEAELALITPPEDEDTREPQTSEQIEEQLRLAGRIESGRRELAQYTAYLDVLERLASASSEVLRDPAMRIEQLVPPGAMGDRNTLYDLQNYVAGPGPDGLVLGPDGALDLERSFARVNYFDLLTGIRVRNNVQEGLANTPVDFMAVRLSCDVIEHLPAGPVPEFCLWIDGGDDNEALLLAYTDAAGALWLRYVPVAGLTQGADGTVRFTQTSWREGLPLALWEDPALRLPEGATREAWLSGWHTDREWLQATHRALYSNAVVGLHEQLAPHDTPSLDANAPGLTDDERVMRRFRARQRALVEADLLVMASNHWNFDVRGFNPGGNHGSFFRASTHSTWMIAGGEQTGIPRGLNVETPYDSLSFVPTVMALTGRLDEDGRPGRELRERGFQPFPGPIVRELFETADKDKRPRESSGSFSTN